ncbi:MAG: hypothetical protein DME26_04930, partial [Verrucomicrobia bacterium]
PTFIGAYPVIGAYSFAMRPRYEFEFPRGLIPYSLSQSGELPADTKSIHFLSYGAPLQLAVNGSLVPVAYAQRLSKPGWDPNIPVFDAAGDISPYAGQTVELKFTTLENPIFPPNTLNG